MSLSKKTAPPDDWREATLQRMRGLILAAVPGITEERKWKKPSNPKGVPVWSKGGIICTGETYKKVVKLTFMQGAKLPDPARLFNAGLEGGTRRAIDIAEGEKVAARPFKALIKAAVALNAALLLLLLAACSPSRRGPALPAPDLLVSVRDTRIDAPDSISAGWTRLRVEEDGAGHIVVLFRLADGGDAAAFLAELDTAVATPPQGSALGGPEIGDTGEVVLQLTPGRYLLGCVRRGEDGHRHALAGESKILIVTAAGATAARDSAPGAAQEVGMVDFAYVGPEVWQSGPQMLRVINRGAQDHQLRLARLRPGASVQKWMSAEDPGTVAEDVAGVARTGPGTVTYLPLDLTPGNYVLYCLVTDPASRAPHVMMGMFRGIEVNDD